MKITLVGVGLIGGSIALKLKKKGVVSYVYGVDKNENHLEEAKNLGLITNVWTVNDVAVYQKLVEMGVGFVTTDIPNELLKY